MVAAILYSDCEFVASQTRFTDKPLQLSASSGVSLVIILCKVENRCAKLFEEFLAAAKVALKRVQAFMKPPCEHELGTIRQKWDMNVYRVGLADSIEATDSLFQQFGVERKIE